jgi:hypothetical protein
LAAQQPPPQLGDDIAGPKEKSCRFQVVMIHGDLASIICVTAWHRFWSALELTQKTVQTLLRHSDVKLTLQCYTHSISEDRMAAAGAMLTAIFSHAGDRSGLRADWEGKTRFR